VENSVESGPQPVEPALAAVRVFAAAQGEENPGPSEDNQSYLTYTLPLPDVGAALRNAQPVVAADGDVDLSWTVVHAGSEREVEITSAGADAWDVVEDKGEDVLVARADLPGPPGTWTSELVAKTLDGAKGTGATLRFEKGPWTEPLTAETGRQGVWVGPSVASFAEWALRNPDAAVDLLGAEGGSFVAVEDGPEEFDPDARLVVAKPAARPPAVPDPPDLAERLAKSGHTDDLVSWRAAHVDVPATLDEEDARRIELVVAWAGARSLAEVEQEAGKVLRPARASATQWSLDEIHEADATPSEALITLARWTAESFDETGLEVARAIAAEKVESPFTAHPAAPVEGSAKIAYQVAISNEVRESLARQNELEKSYLEADAEMARTREAMAAAVDQVVTRALTGALAVAIAALTAKVVRGWPVTIAGGVLAAYLVGNAVYLARPVWRAAKERLASLGKITEGRRDLSATGITQVTDSIDTWRTEVNGYKRWAIVVLVLLGGLALVGGVLANDRISPLYSSSAPVPIDAQGPPLPLGAAAARQTLTELKVAGHGSKKPYDRDRFPHWIGQGASCDTRGVVRIRDGDDVRTGDRCRVKSGTWKSFYDGQTLNDVGDVQVDHVVPLSNAWRSGASTWREPRRRAFANDLADPELIAVSESSNNAKRDQSVEDWPPPKRGARCWYARAWIQVKRRWGLTVTAPEKAALRRMLTTC
jgi:hypothetical protein